MQTPSDKWDNEWLAVDGPGDILINGVNNDGLLPYEGKRVSEIAKEWREDPIDTISSPGLRHLPAHPEQVRARGAQARACRRHP